MDLTLKNLTAEQIAAVNALVGNATAYGKPIDQVVPKDPAYEVKKENGKIAYRRPQFGEEYLGIKSFCTLKVEHTNWKHEPTPDGDKRIIVVKKAPGNVYNVALDWLSAPKGYSFLRDSAGNRVYRVPTDKEHYLNAHSYEATAAGFLPPCGGESKARCILVKNPPSYRFDFVGHQSPREGDYTECDGSFIKASYNYTSIKDVYTRTEV